MGYIIVNVSSEDYTKIEKLEEVKEVGIALNPNVKGIFLQTSAAQYILFTRQKD